MLDKIFAKIEKLLPLKWRWVLSHEGFRRYFSNTGWMFAGQIFALLTSFFIGAWVARYLGPEKYGVINYVVAFVGLFSFLAPLGVDNILSRELVRYPFKRDQLLGTSFRLKIIGGGLAFLAAVTAAFLSKADPLIRLLVVLYAIIFILQSLNVISTFFQAEVAAKNSVRAQVTANFITSFLKILLIISGGGVVGLVIIYVLDVLWQGLGYLAAYRHRGLSIRAWRYDRVLAREIWRSSWPLMLASAAAFIYIRIDQVIVGQLLGNAAVGIYAAAVRVTEVIYFVPGIISASLFPAIVNAKKSGEDLYRSRLKNFYIFILAISLVLVWPIFLGAGFIIRFIFGASYQAAIPVLQIYAWSSVGLFLAWAMGQYLLVENKIKIIFFGNLATVIVNVLLNLWLIPRLGLSGAALATLVSYFIIPLIVILEPKKRPVSP